MSLRIGVDSDGVLADFDKSLVDGYNKHFNANLQYKQITHWDAFQDVTGWTHTQWWEWVVEHLPRLFIDAPALPGAIEGVQTLKDAGHEICIVSAKPAWAAGHMAEWLHTHDIPFDELHITAKKTLVQLDVLIDDALHNCADALEHTDALVIQYAAWPYVNGGQRTPGAVHCTDWRQVVAAINDYDAGRRHNDELCAFNTRRALQGVFT